MSAPDWEFPPDWTPPAHMALYRELEYARLAFRGEPATADEFRETLEAVLGQDVEHSLSARRTVQCLFQIFDALGPRYLEVKRRPSSPEAFPLDPDLMEHAFALLNVSLKSDVAIGEIGIPDGAKLFDIWLADHLIEEDLSSLRERVERWREIRAALTIGTTNERTRAYFREAAAAYAHGMYAATSILARAALEDALKSKLRDRGVFQEGRPSLAALLDQSKRVKLLPRGSDAFQCAIRVQTRGNEAAHPNAKISAEVASACLRDLSVCLEHLFADGDET